MKPTYATSSQAPRRALHQEIGRTRRRPIGRVVAVSVGGTAVAAVAVTASLLIPPGVVGEPQAASASTYLNETAASIRDAVVQPMQVTITTHHLGMIGGPNEKFLPFGSFRTGATAAVVTEASDTYVSNTDHTYSQTSHTDLHAAAQYGDESAVERAWTSYYGSEYPIGAEPATSTEVLEYEAALDFLPVSPSDFPADPAAFLAAWEEGLEAKLVAEKAEAAKMPQDGEPETNGLYESIEAEFAVPAAEHMLNALGHFSSDVAEWKSTFTVAIHALQSERSRTLSGWSHLEQSIREAVACAVGLGLADRQSEQDCESHFHQDKTWLMFAGDYLDYVIPVIGRWGGRVEHSARTEHGAGRLRKVARPHWPP